MAKRSKKKTLPQKAPPKVFHRAGSPTRTTKELIAKFVADSPRAISPAQITALATLTRHTPKTIKGLIEKARDTFLSNAEFYVTAHQKSTEQAFVRGDFEVAQKGAQWAMERLSAEGVRIIEKAPASGMSGTRVLVGIRLGGVDPKQLQPIDIPIATIEGDVEPG